MTLKWLLPFAFLYTTWGTNSAIDFSTISTTILEHRDLIQSSANKEATVFLGYTGSGKSTLINYLTNKGLCCLPDGDIQLEKEDATAMKIGETGESQTRHPQSVCVPIEETTHVFYDLPGFGDTTKDINTQLVNAALIKHILVSAEKVRIVFVASHSDFDSGRAKTLRDLLNIARKIFPEDAHQMITKSSLLVVTKSTQTTRKSAVDFLLKKCRTEDKKLLGVWKRGNKIYHMRKSKLDPEEREGILPAIDRLIAYKPAIVDIGAIYPGEVQATLLNIFLSLIKREFEQTYKEGKETDSLTKLQTCINEYSEGTFWQRFNQKFANLKEVQVLRDLCQTTYEGVVQKFQEENANTPNLYIAALRDREKALFEAVGGSQGGEVNEPHLMAERIRTAQAEKIVALERLSSQTKTLIQLEHYASVTEPLISEIAEKYLEEKRGWLIQEAYRKNVQNIPIFIDMLERNLGDQALLFPYYSQYPLSRTMRQASKLQTINRTVISRFCAKSIGGQEGLTKELKYLKRCVYMRRGFIVLGVVGIVGSFEWPC